jgi:drug/metabolite transporter (DMT)-like permease
VGSLLAFISALSYASGYILVRTGVRPGDPDGGGFITTLFNVLLLGGGALIAVVLRGGANLAPAGLAWFVLAGVLGPFLGRILLFAGIHRLGPVRASSVVNTAPLVTVALAVVLVGEELSPGAIAATALVVVGLGVLAVEAFQHEERFGRGGPEMAAAADEPDVVAAGEPSAAERVRQRLPTGFALGLLVTALSAMSFGVARTARRLGLETMPDPLLGAAIGAFAALLVHLAVNGSRGRLGPLIRANILEPRPRLWAAGTLSGIGLFTFFAALTVAPLAHVAVIAASETIITLILTSIVLRKTERLSLQIVVPAACVFAGGVLVAVS